MYSDAYAAPSPQPSAPAPSAADWGSPTSAIVLDSRPATPDTSADSSIASAVTQTILVPTRAVSPPTPAPSPRPHATSFPNSWVPAPPTPFEPGTSAGSSSSSSSGIDPAQALLLSFAQLPPHGRQDLLSRLVPLLNVSECVHLNHLIQPRLKRDFLKELPLEVSLHILSFIDEPRTLARASQVSRWWKEVVEDEYTWKEMCDKHRFRPSGSTIAAALGSRVAFYRANSLARRTSVTSTNSAQDEDEDMLLAAPLASTSSPFAASTAATSPTAAPFFPLPQQQQQPEESWLPLQQQQPPRIVRPSPLSASAVQRRSVSMGSKARGRMMGDGSTSAPPEGKGKGKQTEDAGFSYKRHFKRAYLTESNWLRGGRLLSSHVSPDDGVVTSLALDDKYIIVGMANCKIHVFDAVTGRWRGALEGHELGVWCLVLVSAGGGPLPEPSPPSTQFDPADPFQQQQTPKRRRGKTQSAGNSPVFEHPSAGAAGAVPQTILSTSPTPGAAPSHFSTGLGFDMYAGYPGHASTSTASSPGPDGPTRPSSHAFPGFAPGFGGPAGPAPGAGGRDGGSNVCGSVRGWGQKGSIVVSGGCDRDVRVWDVASGKCLHTLRGHTSTIRCLKVLPGRPIAVSGSRDATLRVWDVEKGALVHVLAGHQHSVRCVEVAGNRVVSGSYDCTCRMWDVDTGECLHVFRGHIHQIYAVAFDGIRVATGSLDSTVRVWSALTGECLALLQGHTSLVGQLQLTDSILVTGGSDGRVIVFSLATFECLHRICAHDNSVTCLQFDDRFIISGGNDGKVKIWDIATGQRIRDLSEPCEAVWRISFMEDKCVLLCKRGGKTVMEVITFQPQEDEI